MRELTEFEKSLPKKKKVFVFAGVEQKNCTFKGERLFLFFISRCHNVFHHQMVFFKQKMNKWKHTEHRMKKKSIKTTLEMMLENAFSH
jgi:hypothetical protein